MAELSKIMKEEKRMMEVKTCCTVYLQTPIGCLAIEADEIGVTKVMLSENIEEESVGCFSIEADKIDIKKVMLEDNIEDRIEEAKNRHICDKDRLLQNVSKNVWVDAKNDNTTYSMPENGKKAQQHLYQAYTQLQEYFQGSRKTFDVPVHMNGTPFQQSVWKALQDIPYGETRSYKDIATAIGNPKACRAVGMANNRNQILILVPCHRVIGADGSLVGFGCGLDAKKYLLNLEK